MRHRRTTATLGRAPAHRKAMLRNMVTDLLRHEKIRTTEAKAKVLRPLAERMITLGKRESLHARRHAARIIRDKAVLRKLFDDLAPRYAERPGGYTRITKLSARPGDQANMAVIELVEAELQQRKRKRKKKTGPRTASQDTVAAVVPEAADVDEDAEVAEASASEDAAESEASPADAAEDGSADDDAADNADVDDSASQEQAADSPDAGDSPDDDESDR